MHAYLNIKFSNQLSWLSSPISFLLTTRVCTWYVCNGINLYIYGIYAYEYEYADLFSILVHSIERLKWSKCRCVSASWAAATHMLISLRTYGSARDSILSPVLVYTYRIYLPAIASSVSWEAIKMKISGSILLDPRSLHASSNRADCCIGQQVLYAPFARPVRTYTVSLSKSWDPYSDAICQYLEHGQKTLSYIISNNWGFKGKYIFPT